VPQAGSTGAWRVGSVPRVEGPTTDPSRPPTKIDGHRRHGIGAGLRCIAGRPGTEPGQGSDRSPSPAHLGYTSPALNPSKNPRWLTSADLYAILKKGKRLPSHSLADELARTPWDCGGIALVAFVLLWPFADLAHRAPRSRFLEAWFLVAWPFMAVGVGVPWAKWIVGATNPRFAIVAPIGQAASSSRARIRPAPCTSPPRNERDR
jgi:hypothetical protein